MPIAGARYRTLTTKSGKKIRLAFKGKRRVVEAKNLKTGATHTPAEFARDRSLAKHITTLRAKGQFKTRRHAA